jgi:hypothetical protein
MDANIRNEFIRVLVLPFARRALFHCWPGGARSATVSLIRVGNQHMSRAEASALLSFVVTRPQDEGHRRKLFAAGLPFLRSRKVELSKIELLRRDLDLALFCLVFTTYYSGPETPVRHPLINQPEKDGRPLTSFLHALEDSASWVGYLTPQSDAHELAGAILRMRSVIPEAEAWIEGLEAITSFD